MALLAYIEIVQGRFDSSFLPEVGALAAFLRSMQRSDGEFMHLYDVARQRAIDKQLPFYSGEAALALARTHRLTRNPADLNAARRVIAYLSQDSQSYFGSHYIYDAQHWTCQAVEDLWLRAPNRDALDFCLNWQAYSRSTMFGPWTDLGDYDGGYSRLPWYPPRICSSGSRNEAAIATIVTGSYAGLPQEQLRVLEDQVKRAFAYLLRQQFSPGPFHLMKAPFRMRGGLPESPFPLNSRIDMVQHAGSAMIRYIKLLEQREQGAVTPPC